MNSQPLMLIAFLVSFSARAALQAPPFSIVATPQQNRLELTATPPPAHHFNTRAPMELLIGKRRPMAPMSATLSEVRFSEAPLKGEFRVNLYLCDDKNTFCESHLIGATWDASTKKLSTTVLAEEKSYGSRTPTPPTKAHGFLVNQPDAALQRAAKERKPLIIDFFGIWCPPCNQLDDKVFAAKEFQDSSKRFVKVKLDADAEISWKLKARYKVGGYPTVILATADGEEISRIVGFVPKEFFLKELDAAFELRDLSTTTLTAQAEQGSEAARLRLGRRHLGREEFTEAMKWLGKVPAAREDFLKAQAGSTKDPKALRKVLETQLREFPVGTKALEARIALVDAVESDAKAHAAALHDLADAALKLVADPAKLVGTEWTESDLLSTAANAQESLGDGAQARATWTKAVDSYRKRIGQGDERGTRLELAYALWKSGQPKEAESLYQTLEKSYPQEFTFYYSHASMLLKEKRTAEALPLAQRAYDRSYGDNRLRAAQLLAKTFKALDRPKDGLQVVQATLATTRVPADPELRTHRYIKQLRDLAATL